VLFSFGTAEKMPIIDKIRIHPALSILHEDGLSIIGVAGTNVDQPCQPETFVVTNTLQAAPGEDFQ